MGVYHNIRKMQREDAPGGCTTTTSRATTRRTVVVKSSSYYFLLLSLRTLVVLLLNLLLLFGQQSLIILSIVPVASAVVMHPKSSTYSYNICNGLTNQLLYHAGAIATAIKQGSYEVVEIPDYFIVNGVQQFDSDVLPNPASNAIPFGVAFDEAYFLQTVRGLGVQAKLVPFDFYNNNNVSPSNKNQQTPCAGMETLKKSDPNIALLVLKAFRPSRSMENLIQKVVKRFENKDMADGICVHHRDGHDWYNHCQRWESIKDLTYRGNCRGIAGRSFLESLEDRGLTDESKWVYYCGDHEIPQDLKESKYTFVSRSELLTPQDIAAAKQVARVNNKDDTSLRDFWALVDFFVCRQMGHFIGNSVSTFSAVQIALREGEKAFWYNSQSIPLSNMWSVYQIPVVYTYTELSKKSGRHLLQTSITSVRQQMPRNKIHILYHGTNDTDFQSWLKEKGVIIHPHNPVWKDDIERMRVHGSLASSHLFSHEGNYFGTWQRIDIPLMIESEYCLLLDVDTVVVRPFTLADFGADMTHGIAMSNEVNMGDTFPSNAGVTLMNIPYLRRTHADFLRFIFQHVDTAKFDHPSPSDQGAYLDFYRASARFLSPRFNYKPYWKPPKGQLKDPIILHFHGAKPHDYMKYIFGSGCDPAIQFLCVQASELQYLCPSFQVFARASKAVDPFEYCEASFSESSEAVFCNNILDNLATLKGECTDLPGVIRKELRRVPSRFSLRTDLITKRLVRTNEKKRMFRIMGIVFLANVLLGMLFVLHPKIKRKHHLLGMLAFIWAASMFGIMSFYVSAMD